MPKKSRKRLTKKNATRSAVFALVWYLPETYERCRLMFRDDDELPDTYEEWAVEIAKFEQNVSRQGFRVIRVVLDLDVFTQWCRDNGHRSLNGAARSAFAADMATKRAKGDL